MPNKKEPLSLIVIKTLLAVIIFTGVGTIIIGGGWLIGKQKNNVPINNIPVEKCAKAGEMSSNPSLGPSAPTPRKCCEGLVEIYAGLRYEPNSEIADEDGCVNWEGSASMCSDCGNGICESWENKCNCSEDCVEKEVTITTDKTEYEQGEMVEITFDNNKPEPIYVYFEGCRHFTEPIGYVRESVQRFWNMNKFEDGKWRKLITNFDLYDDIFCYTDSAGWDTILKEFKSPIVVKWNQTTYANYPRKASEAVTSGKFKVEFCYFDEKDVSITEKEVYNEKLNKNITVKLFQGAPKKKKCIEKEFTIKEKSALDPRCGEKVVDTGGVGNNCAVISFGYEYNSLDKKCVAVSVRGCYMETPFKSLEECQRVCEKGKDICMNEDDECTIRDIDCCDGLKKAPLIYEKENEECGVALPCGSICIPCGNGICDRRENKCNCPEDCK